jgi:hypothetical protein
MEHRDFVIGGAFATRHSLWRCTDIGTRTVVAIQLDRMEVVEVKGGREQQRTIDPRREPSWLSGPPYVAAEQVFDNCDFPACRPVDEEEVARWEPERG